MQTLDIISVNIWQILISLANLFILFLIIKKFLFKPVKNILAKRAEELQEQYHLAEEAKLSALSDEAAWKEKMESAHEKADSIIRSATEKAKDNEEKILSRAKAEADSIIEEAKEEAILEHKKAADCIKQEIVQVSGVLAEKLLGREINPDDHRNLINAFIAEIDDGDAHG